VELIKAEKDINTVQFGLDFSSVGQKHNSL